MLRIRLRTLLVILSALSLLFCFGKIAWDDWAAAIPHPESLRQVKYNMSQEEVLLLLGEPAWIRTVENLKSMQGHEYWHYERLFDETSIQVHFDPSGRVMSASKIR